MAHSALPRVRVGPASAQRVDLVHRGSSGHGPLLTWTGHDCGLCHAFYIVSCHLNDLSAPLLHDADADGARRRLPPLSFAAYFHPPLPHPPPPLLLHPHHLPPPMNNKYRGMMATRIASRACRCTPQLPRRCLHLHLPPAQWQRQPWVKEGQMPHNCCPDAQGRRQASSSLRAGAGAPWLR